MGFWPSGNLASRASRVRWIKAAFSSLSDILSMPAGSKSSGPVSWDKLALLFRTDCPIDGGMSPRFKTFRDVIGLWRSPGAMASDIGVSADSARKWHQRDSIPAEWWTALLATPRARKAGLTAEALVELAARAPAEERAG
jgi:hypothetical protein